MTRAAVSIVVFGAALLCAAAACAQPVCPFTPSATAKNTLCANTAFVKKAIGATNPTVLSYTVSTLPTPTAGMMAYVTDGTLGLSWGATVTGGHSTPYLVWYNGTNWTVVGE